MRVEIDVELFDNLRSALDLQAIAWVAFQGRHRLLLSDDKDQRFLAWLNGLDIQHQEEWQLLMSEAFSLESREPAERAVVVTVLAQSDWTIVPPRLTLTDAAAFLQRPFIALLEDSSSDRGFLRAVASSAERAFFDRMEEIGGLTYENGGGITSMTRRVGSLTPEARARMWALFDSDALQPGQPSGQSQNTAQACNLANIPFHQLSRRSIENYLPLSVLKLHAEASGNARAERLKRVRALQRLTADQKAHWSMKSGFDGDARRNDGVAGDLFANVTEADRQTLNSGFGDHVADLFLTSAILETELDDDGSLHELRGMTNRLVAFLR